MANSHAARRKERMGTPFRRGECVIIRSNPHDMHAENIAGIVVKSEPVAGVGGCTLFDVKYTPPFTSVEQISLFSPSCLERADFRSLMQLAEYHELQAAYLRKQADTLRPTSKLP